jgi:hypothetical protein
MAVSQRGMRDHREGHEQAHKKVQSGDKEATRITPAR